MSAESTPLDLSRSIRRSLRSSIEWVHTPDRVIVEAQARQGVD
jgi:hypothetical protein